MRKTFWYREQRILLRIAGFTEGKHALDFKIFSISSRSFYYVFFIEFIELRELCYRLNTVDLTAEESGG